MTFLHGRQWGVPYTRHLLLDTPVLRWQRLALQDAQPAWSEPYEVASQRLLIPLAGRFDCRLGAQAWLCDAASALWLTPRTGWRKR